jgi:diguanylate cyclase (GGDEF)-like protein
VRLYLQNKELDRRRVQLVAQNIELEQLSQYDPLTELMNRRSLDLSVQQLLSSKSGVPAPVTVFLFDIDRFKEFNDRFGHLVGDDVLKMVATTAKKILANGELACRFGGEEFLIVRLERLSAKESRALAEKLRSAVAAMSFSPNIGGEDCQGVTISVGVAASDIVRLDDFYKIIAQADEALYAAKRNGRNISMLHQTIGPSVQ